MQAWGMTDRELYERYAYKDPDGLIHVFGYIDGFVNPFGQKFQDWAVTQNINMISARILPPL